MTTFREEVIKAIAVYWQMQASDDVMTNVRLNESRPRDVLVQMAMCLHTEGYPGFSARRLAQVDDETIIRRVADYLAHEPHSLAYVRTDPDAMARLTEATGMAL